MSRIYSAVPSQRVSNAVLEWRQISVMSNHRRLDYSFNSLPRLITKEKSKIFISGSLWVESGDRWTPLGKSRQLKKRFHVIEPCILTTHQRRYHQSYWYIFNTLTHWKVFGTDFFIRMARLQIDQNKSRIKFLSKSRVVTDLRHGVAHATSLQWYIRFETGPWLKVWKAFALGRKN